MVVSLSLVTFLTGSVLACSGNYCGSVNTTDCVQVDVIDSESCCLTLDSTGRRCWTCSRDEYLCFDGNGDLVSTKGQAYNCSSPGGSCL